MGTITFDVNWVIVLQFILATLLPLLVAIVTKRSQSGRVKGTLLAVLALLSSILAQIYDALVTGASLDLANALLVALGSFVVSVGFYYGLWSTKGDDGKSITNTLQAKVGVTDGR